MTTTPRPDYFKEWFDQASGAGDHLDEISARAGWEASLRKAQNVLDEIDKAEILGDAGKYRSARTQYLDLFGRV